jgi:uncharacterized protein YcbK (DUF882 family)
MAAAVCAACVASPSGVDATPKWALAGTTRTTSYAVKKLDPLPAPEGVPSSTSSLGAPRPLLATLVQTHTDERVPLDDASPTQDRFASLLSDRVTGEKHAFDPRLLDLLRSLAKRHNAAGPPRIELVSGYRSPKLNEMMRKKGRHVASHSQHSLGHAVDFRIVLPNEERGLDPRVLEQEIRELGWSGGVGVYLMKSDWFVHADVGPNRRWNG